MATTTPLLAPVPVLPYYSFLYPLFAIPYLLTHRSLHPPLYSRLIPLTLLSVIITATLFTLLFIPHLIVLSIFHPPGVAATNAVLMLLSESTTLVAMIAESFLTEVQVVEVFDRVFLSAPHGLALISQIREIEAADGRGQVILGKHLVDPCVRWKDGLRAGCYYLLELPLNLIPVVGTVLFVLLQGYHLGPLSHYRYFQLKGWDKKMRKRWVKVNRWKYTMFGAMHVVLQLVPVLSIFFLFSTGVGAALWAVEGEKKALGEETEGDGWWRWRRGWGQRASGDRA